VQRAQRGGDGIDEDRDHRHGGGITEEFLQWLHGAVVDVHTGRDCYVDIGIEHMLGQLGGQRGRYVQRPGLGAVVPDATGRGADAERRHQLVEEAVVVVRREDDDQLRVVFADEVACGPQCALHVLKQFR
jgi:hypothetical protein